MTNMAMRWMWIAGLLSSATPMLARATPGDAHDDVTYPATEATEIPGAAHGPKVAAFDDAPYGVDRDAQEAAPLDEGIAIRQGGGPELEGHDDTSYGPVAPAPSESSPAFASGGTGEE
jgi:hypothetical protein